MATHATTDALTGVSENTERALSVGQLATALLFVGVWSLWAAAEAGAHRKAKHEHKTEDVSGNAFPALDAEAAPADTGESSATRGVKAPATAAEGGAAGLYDGLATGAPHHSSWRCVLSAGGVVKRRSRLTLTPRALAKLARFDAAALQTSRATLRAWRVVLGTALSERRCGSRYFAGRSWVWCCFFSTAATARSCFPTAAR